MGQIYPIYHKLIISLCDAVLAIIQELYLDDGEMNLSFALHYLMPWGPRFFPEFTIISDSTRTSYFRTQVMVPLITFPDLREVTTTLASSVDDQQRSQIFARSATYCIQWLSTKGRFEKETLHILGITDKRKIRRRPWMWRRTPPHRSLSKQWVIVSEKFGGSHFTRYERALRRCGKNTGAMYQMCSMKEYFGHVRSKEAKNPWQNWSLYIRLLKVLSYFLRQAERYDPLICMCQEPVFAFMSCLFPRNVRRSRIAMKNYLDRVEPKS